MNGRAGLVQGSMTSAFISLRKLRSSFFSAVILLTRVISRLQSQLCGLPVHPIWYCTAVVTPLSFSVQRFQSRLPSFAFSPKSFIEVSTTRNLGSDFGYIYKNRVLFLVPVILSPINDS